MKLKAILLFVVTLNATLCLSQFESTSDVVAYSDGKTYYSSSSGLEISYTYISRFNTYGIKLKNKHGVEFFYINCEISCYGRYADIYGMSPEDGSNFGYRLFDGKIIIGYGEPGASTYYEN